MLIVKAQITTKLNEKNLTIYQLNKLMNFSEGSLRKMINNKSPFSENAIEKILPVLEISREDFDSWIVADKYSKEVLELALQTKINFPYKRKLILTTKIDDILQKINMSRTDLSKQIKYSQSGLNQIITGKRSLSESVLEKLVVILEISKDKILSWILADKYSLRVLKLAYDCKSNNNY